MKPAYATSSGINLSEIRDGRIFQWGRRALDSHVTVDFLTNESRPVASESETARDCRNRTHFWVLRGECLPTVVPTQKPHQKNIFTTTLYDFNTSNQKWCF